MAVLAPFCPRWIRSRNARLSRRHRDCLSNLWVDKATLWWKNQMPLWRGESPALVGKFRLDTFRQLRLGLEKKSAWVNSAPVKEKSLPWGGEIVCHGGRRTLPWCDPMMRPTRAMDLYLSFVISVYYHKANFITSELRHHDEGSNPQQGGALPPR